MLAGRRSIKLKGQELARTPMLVPSFSSKGFPDVQEIIETNQEVIENFFLISAYDIANKHITPPFDFAPLVFLDSGGYEASKDTDLSDLGDSEYEEDPTWTPDKYQAVLSSWDSKIPTVFISYDHPKHRVNIEKQIENAKKTLPKSDSCLREILLKPESRTSRFLNIDSIVDEIHDLADFDIIGVTEKEIGTTLQNRMKNIARLRIALTKAGLQTPIHVFGSLDTVTTPLFFLSGADIFDGLTWLRFAYFKGYTIYKHNYGAVELGIDTKHHLLNGHCWWRNYYYLQELERQMKRFLKNQDYTCFDYHSDLFKRSCEAILEELEVDDGW